MSYQIRVQRQANYGIDAPNAVLGFAILGIAAIVSTGIVSLLFSTFPLSHVLSGLGVLIAVACFGFVGFLVWGSKAGKLQIRDRLVNSISWRGDETVLDVGCGRGLLLIGAAKHLTTGKAIGVDIWQTADQSGNRPEATVENARIEEVEDRIEVKDGDARQLPFGDNIFDVVMSNAVLHNIPNKAQREDALREMVRVLKPGGRVSIYDGWVAGEYAGMLRKSGLTEISQSEAMHVLFPIAHVVMGRKPVAGGE